MGISKDKLAAAQPFHQESWLLATQPDPMSRPCARPPSSSISPRMGCSPWGVCTWLYVLPYNRDMAVPVGPRVLVPEANDMAQLMDHDAKLVTVLADGDGLGAPTSATHVGAAPGGRGQLRGVVPSWGSASTQGPGQAAKGCAGVQGDGDDPEHPMRRLYARVRATSMGDAHSRERRCAGPVEGSRNA